MDVYFEEKNIHSISHDVEFLLTLLGSYAQEKSYSASENQKWRIRKKMLEGLIRTMEHEDIVTDTFNGKLTFTLRNGMEIEV